MNNPNIEYDKINHTLTVGKKVIFLSNEVYVTDNIPEKIRIIAADLGLRLNKIEQDTIISFISIEVSELIAKKLAKYSINAKEDNHIE